MEQARSVSGGRPVVGLALVALVSLAACGGNPASSGSTTGGSSAGPTNSGPTSPEPTGPMVFPELRNTERHLQEGTYVTSTFSDPTLTLTLPGAWTFFDQGPTDLQLNMGTSVHLESQLLLFNFFGRVVDPGDDHSITETNDLISWIEQHPNLEVTRDATPVEVGGVEGTAIDFRPTGAPLCTYYTDGSRCWNLMPIIDGDPFTPANQELGTMFVVGGDDQSPDVMFSYRLTLVDFDGSQVVFIWQEDTSVFDQTVQTYGDVLGSIEVGA
jgi:hypothetical protein